MNSKKLAVVFSRCSQTRAGFGIRFERDSDQVWLATWTFAIKGSSAKKEGYQSSPIVGKFGTSNGYPGCPHCSATGFFRCGCGGLGCWDMSSNSVTCPTCGQTGVLEGEITSLEGGSDR